MNFKIDDRYRNPYKVNLDVCKKEKMSISKKSIILNMSKNNIDKTFFKRVNTTNHSQLDHILYKPASATSEIHLTRANIHKKKRKNDKKFIKKDGINKLAESKELFLKLQSKNPQQNKLLGIHTN